MIQIGENLWVGDSSDEKRADLAKHKIGGVLNVAQDLSGTRGWRSGIEYMQHGLVDGPGNEVIDYCGAIMAIVTLLRRHDVVMVCDHDGGRALAVVAMYLNLVCGQFRANPLAWSHWMTWEQRVSEIALNTGGGLPEPHAAHVEAFGLIPYGLLEAFL